MTPHRRAVAPQRPAITASARGDGEEALIGQACQEGGVPDLMVRSSEEEVVEGGQPHGSAVPETANHLVEVQTSSGKTPRFGML